MKKPEIKKSVLHMWLISYLLVLIVPLSFSQFLYWTSKAIVEKNANLFAQTTLLQTETSLEKIIQEVQATGQELLARGEVASLMYADHELTNIKRDKIRLLQEEMMTCNAHNPYVSDIYILFNYPQFAASTDGFYRELGTFNDMLLQNYDISLETLTQWEAEEGFFHLKALGDGKEAQELLAFMKYSVKDIQTNVTVLLVIDASQIRKVLGNQTNESLATTKIWVESQEGLAISPAAFREFTEEFSPDVLNGESVSYWQFNEQKLALASVYSSITGWTLVSATLLSEYTAQLSQITVYYWIYLMVCIIAGIAISLYFARRHYTPVRRLSEMLRQNAVRFPAGSEFAQLEAGLAGLLRQSQEQEREIDKQKKALRQTALTRMLRGSYHSDQAFASACSDYSLRFSSQSFSVVGILINDYSNLFLEGKPDESEETLELVYLAVTSVAEELLRECGDAYLCQTEGNLYAILSPQKPFPLEETITFTEKVKGSCRKAESFIRERLGVMLSFYVSGLYTGQETNRVRGIAAAFQEVQWGFEQIEGFRLKTVVNSKEDISGQSDIPIGLQPSEYAAGRRQFFAAVYSGRFDEADRLYLELRNEGLSQLEKSFSSIRVQTIFLLNYLVSHVEQSRLEKNPEEVERFLYRIRKAHHTEELSRVIHEASVFIHNLIEKGTENIEISDIASKIAGYIQENYQNPGISVMSIAESFSISQSYLLRVFKRSYEQGILDYIHQCRVDKAKAMLRETNNTVECIAEAAGFSNALALIRTFRKLEGTTPTVYRKIVR